MREGGFDHLHACEQTIASACVDEMRSIATAIFSLDVKLPNLISFSTGVYLGGKSSIWERMTFHQPPIPYFQLWLSSARQSLMVNGGNHHAVYICARVEFGPLTFIGSMWLDIEKATPSFLSKGPRGLSHTAHLSTIPGSTSAVLGGAGRTYYEFKETEVSDLAAGMRYALVVVKLQLSNREGLLGSLDAEQRSRANFKLDQAVQSYHVELGVPKSRWKGDRWTLKKLEEAETCPARQWSVEDI
jgi:hypothetical protein